jgi:hypothetical protein
MNQRFFSDPEAILGTLARLFASDGKPREVAILAYSTPDIQQTDYDNYDGGQTFYTLYLHAPVYLYTQLEDAKEDLERSIQERLQTLVVQFRKDHLDTVRILPAAVEDEQWREKAIKWLTGDRVSNQGRVRSDNVAPLRVDGLLFRSQPEIHLYRALKALGVSFAPLPVFVRGGTSYQRLEPDFVIVKDGITMIVEVDGDTVHHETPAEAHTRTVMLVHEGVRLERFSAEECATPDKAATCARKILTILDKLKGS